MGRHLSSTGYIRITENGRNADEHVLIAEKALGKSLPKGAEVHHVDEDKTNNEPSNLVICPDTAYHRLLHMRQAAMNACGNPNWLKCKYCKKYDSPENLSSTPYKSGPQTYHKVCYNAYMRDSNLKRKNHAA